jgi:hypothetical protein
MQVAESNRYSKLFYLLAKKSRQPWLVDCLHEKGSD